MRFDPRLSAVRGLAALGVALDHGISSTGANGSALGDAGVAAFLALSVALLLPGLDRAPRLLPYFRRRILRIWPLYFATCAAVFVLWDHDPAHLAGNLGFVALWVPSLQFDFTPWAPHFVLWTLQLEEIAYLLLPLLARLGTTGRSGVALGLLAVGSSGAALSWFGFGGYGADLAVWAAPYGVGILISQGKLSGPVAWAIPMLVALGAAETVFVRSGTFVVIASPVLGTIIARPPAVIARWPLVLLGESSYGLYLTHALWLAEFGLLGLVVSVPVSMGVELASRPRAFLRRLRGHRNSLVSGTASPGPG